jgi:hypothetical protein
MVLRIIQNSTIWSRWVLISTRPHINLNILNNVKTKVLDMYRVSPKRLYNLLHYTGCFSGACIIWWNTTVFPGIKRPGLGASYSALSSAEVKERIQWYLYSLCGPPWPVLGWTLLYTACVLKCLYNMMKYTGCSESARIIYWNNLQTLEMTTNLFLFAQY